MVNSTFSERVEAIAREPLTPLSKILLVLTLVLLLFTSVSVALDSFGPIKVLKITKGLRWAVCWCST